VRLFEEYRAELVAHERPMYELDNAADQVMNVCTVALTNLVLWVREQYFPASYRHATWARLAHFFRLPGRIVCTPSAVQVSLRPFPVRAWTRDLARLCERVAAARPRLPDGRVLTLSIVDVPHPLLYEQIVAVA
jgi:hypothetical protein